MKVLASSEISIVTDVKVSKSKTERLKLTYMPVEGIIEFWLKGKMIFSIQACEANKITDFFKDIHGKVACRPGEHGLATDTARGAGMPSGLGSIGGLAAQRLSTL